jgi:hypothetical protein
MEYEGYTLNNHNVRKRLVLNSNHTEGLLEDGLAGAIVQRKVAEFVDRFESDMGKD